MEQRVLWMLDQRHRGKQMKLRNIWEWNPEEEVMDQISMKNKNKLSKGESLHPADTKVSLIHREVIDSTRYTESRTFLLWYSSQNLTKRKISKTVVNLRNDFKWEASHFQIPKHYKSSSWWNGAEVPCGAKRKTVENCNRLESQKETCVCDHVCFYFLPTSPPGGRGET